MQSRSLVGVGSGVVPRVFMASDYATPCPFSYKKNIPSAFVTEDNTISHDLKDNNFCGSHRCCNLHVVLSVCQYVRTRG